jgi:IS30 family transposase
MNKKFVTHLSLEDRKNIELGIIEGLSKSQIAKKINRSPATIANEILKHRKIKPRNTFNLDSICIHLKDCQRCTKKCERYQEPYCKRRDRSIGACNSCPDIGKCRLDKYFYYAVKANQAYLYTLVDSRVGVNLDYPELKQIATIMKPLLDKGQTIYQILENHREITQCSKTLYTYIEMGLFKEFGIDNFSLKKQVSRRIRSKKLKKRRQPVNYEGREYKDYLEYVKAHPFETTTEMDTVYNSQSGPFIQTFIFENTGLMIGFLHKEKTSASMASTLDTLQELLQDDYYTHFSLLLTDRGSEFEKYELFENDSNKDSRGHIFYCDPQRPDQKPHVENNHNFVRNILPNKRILDKLTQEDLNLMFSHINSVPRKSLGGKTPYEVFTYFYGDEVLKKLKIQRIEKDMVTLQPYLLKIQ